MTIPNVKTNKYTKAQALSGLMLSPHFSVKEYSCDDCLKSKGNDDIVCYIDPNLITLMEKLRVKVNIPIAISSGYRCPRDNKLAQGASQSRHIFGMANDFDCNNKLNGILVLDYAYEIFPRIGFYQSSQSGHCYMHVDTDPKRLFWLARKVNGNNVYQYFKTMDAMKNTMKADTKISWYHLSI